MTPVGVVRASLSAVLVLVVSVLAGCTASGDYDYANNGIGTDLARPNATREYQIRELYFGYLCGSAGLPDLGRGSEGLPRCHYGGFSGGDWDQMVQAGMNDIDQRCDAWLAWHDARKRSSAAVNGQLNTTSQFVQAIIRLYEPTSLAADIVGMAFGFSTASLDNYDKRLLFQINTSTLQSLVLKRQQDFRIGLRRARVDFDGKPSVEHALRSYLRICMPMTIETEINTVLNVFDRTGVEPRDLITPETSRAATGFEPFRAEERVDVRPIRQVIVTPPEVSKVIKIANVTDRDLRRLQRALCVPADGKDGPMTIYGIEIFEQMSTGQPWLVDDGVISDRTEFAQATSLGDCNAGTYRNLLEFKGFMNSDTVADLLGRLNERDQSMTVDTAKPLSDPEVRRKIRETNRKEGIPDFGGIAADHITPALLKKLGLI